MKTKKHKITPKERTRINNLVARILLKSSRAAMTATKWIYFDSELESADEGDY